MGLDNIQLLEHLSTKSSIYNVGLKMQFLWTGKLVPSELTSKSAATKIPIVKTNKRDLRAAVRQQAMKGLMMVRRCFSLIELIHQVYSWPPQKGCNIIGDDLPRSALCISPSNITNIKIQTKNMKAWTQIILWLWKHVMERCMHSTFRTWSCKVSEI